MLGSMGSIGRAQPGRVFNPFQMIGGPAGIGAHHLAAALAASMEAGHTGPNQGVAASALSHLKETTMVEADCQKCGECSVCFEDFSKGTKAV